MWNRFYCIAPRVGAGFPCNPYSRQPFRHHFRENGDGTTAEDRFFGVINAAGISAIHISNTGGGIEVDHLQYGVFSAAPPPPQPTTTIPVPTMSEGALALLALVAAAFGFVVLGRRRA